MCKPKYTCEVPARQLFMKLDQECQPSDLPLIFINQSEYSCLENAFIKPN